MPLTNEHNSEAAPNRDRHWLQGRQSDGTCNVLARVGSGVGCQRWSRCALRREDARKDVTARWTAPDAVVRVLPVLTGIAILSHATIALGCNQRLNVRRTDDAVVAQLW
jgi:hypothetical protein